ncbi:hypothetical protein MKQ68_14085 [Chitinophaga horti]|uniref:VCBS repeat-containing protein n=1 Tax=Chitinophaga horti TaxID=2920382 RepID=A0ABY6IV28_9BACT|nr:hypothetical protein [Chitinophaga horti]UYQ91221.1 hypothetical protein MKQ68_14085 [Chitinophaga horti]
MRMFLTLLATLITHVAVGQHSLDSLTNDSTVIAFVNHYGKQASPPWRGWWFDVKRLEGLTKPEWVFLKEFYGTKYLLADLSGDGKKDLVANGNPTGWHGTRILVFLTTPNGIELARLGAHSAGLGEHISLYNDGGEMCLVLGHLSYTIGNQSPPAEKIIMDTLRYRFGGFVNYKPAKVPSPAFDTLSFKVASSWSSYPRYALSVTKDGKLTLLKERLVIDYAKETSHMDTITIEKRLSPETMDTLQQIIRWSGYCNLPQGFETPHLSDVETAVTRVVFEDGISWQINDYGSEGTYELRLLYDRMWRWLFEAFKLKY